MQYVQTLASYLPSIIIQNLLEEGSETPGQALAVPRRQTFETVCVFCDVSGFTALSEAMAKNGKGAEGLAKHLNSYFSQMVKALSSEGGDIFKFAGDAMIVLWPPSEEPMGNLLRRAAQCAIAIQKALHKADLEEGVQLSVKIGIGYGPVSVLHIGGVFNRTEYLAVGEPLLQAFNAEHHAVSGQVIISAKAWEFLKDHFQADEVYYDDYVRLNLDSFFNPLRKKKPLNVLEDEGDNLYLEAALKGYVAGAVLGNLNPESVEDEVWGNETRRVAVIFVNLGLTEQHLLASALYNDAMEQVHGVLVAVQKAVYTYEGSVNKFLMDDKGSTLIACFGLPPLPHKDDSLRAVMASIAICESLWKLGFKASIGITKGDVFCGIVGSKTRREYSILGDSVNLSARLMQRACGESGGVICDEEVMKECGSNIDTMEIGQITVKGKSQPINVYRPYPQDLYERFDIKEKLIIDKNPYTPILQHQLATFNNDRMLATVDGIVNRGGGHKSMKALLYSAPNSPTNNSSSKAPRSPGRGSIMPGLGGGGPGSGNGNETPSTNSGPKKRMSGLNIIIPGTGGGSSAPPTPTGGQKKKTKSKSILSPGGLKGLGFSALGGSDADLNSPNGNGGLNSPGGSDSGSITPRRQSTATKKKDEENIFNHHTKIDYVEIAVPPKFDFDALASNETIHLEKIPVSNLLKNNNSDVLTIQDLYRKAFEIAQEMGYALPQREDNKEWEMTEIRLGFPNTHFFLPYASSTPIHYLGSYLACAMEDIGEDPNVYDKDSYTLKLCMLSTAEMKSRQSRRGYVKSALTDAKLDLIENGTCKLIFLEGEAGVGKSKLLTDILSNPPVDGCAYYVASPSPFELLKPFGCLIPIFKHYLQARKGRPDAEGKVPNLTTLLLKELVENPYPENISTYPHVLNPILGTTVPEIAVPANFDAKSHQVLLLSWLLVCIGQHRRSIMLADDGTYIDPSTWQVFDTFVNRPTTTFYSSSLTIIIAHRTFYRHYTRLFPIPPSYLKLINAVTTNYPVECLKLDNMLQDEVANYIIQELCGMNSLNVKSISDNVFKLIDGKCQGNPFMINEYLKLLYEDGQLIFAMEDLDDDDDDGTDDITYVVTLKDEYEGIAMNFNKITESSESFNRIPKDVTDMISPQLDRLNSCQTMILKTISFSRKEFELSFLMDVFPLESHKPNVKYEINRLEELGFLEGHRTTGAWRLKYKPDKKKNQKKSYDEEEAEKNKQLAEQEANKLVYRFNNTFVREVMKKRMLKEHVKKVKEKVDKEQRQLDIERRQIFSSKFGEPVEPMKEGYIHIKKKNNNDLLKVKRKLEGSSWKLRYCEIILEDGQKMLRMYKDKPIPGSKKSRDELITQTIFLDGGKADKDVSAKEKHEHSFVIFANRYLDAKIGKSTVPINENRSFHFRCDDDKDLQDWIYMAQYLIEMNIKDYNQKQQQSQKKQKELEINEKDSSEEEDEEDDDKNDEKFFTRPSNFTSSIFPSSNDEDEDGDKEDGIESEEVDEEELQEMAKTLDAVVHVAVNELRDIDDFPVVEYSYRPYLKVLLEKQENPQVPVIKEAKVTSEKTFSSFNDVKRESFASTASSTSLPLISEDVIVPVKFSNWQKNSLKVQVWNWDPQLSDDFIGECWIPFSDIEASGLSTRNENKDEDEENAKSNQNSGMVASYSLVKRNSQIVGSITLTARLYLSPHRESQYEEQYARDLSTLINETAILYERERIAKDKEEKTMKEEEMKKQLQADMEARLQSTNTEDEKIKEQINELLKLSTGQNASSNNNYNNNDDTNNKKNNLSLSIDTNITSATSTNTAPNVDVAVEEATRRLKSIIMCIRNREPICQPTEDNKAIDQQWIYNNLCSTLTILSPSLLLATNTSENFAFKELLEKADIKEQDREWLQMTYNRGSYHDFKKDGEKSQELVVEEAVDRRVSISKERRESVKNLHGFSSLQNLKDREQQRQQQQQKGMNLDRSSSLQSDSDTALSLTSDNNNDKNLTEEEELTEEESYFYIDKNNNVQGPFAVKKILAWYYAGYLHEQVLLRKGGATTTTATEQQKGGETNPFIPLSMHLDTMRSLPTDLSLIADLSEIIPKIIVEDDPTRQYWSWSFDVYQLEVKELFAFLWVMLEHLELPSIFNFNPKTFWNFISLVEHYMSRHKNPYHNFYHIVDVTHACFVILVNFKAERFFNKLEIFTCLLAAICHDLDHPGTNNMYQVNAVTPLAILYNDQSVLENHHGAIAFRILRRKDCNMISSLTETESKRFRNLFIQLILGTDMSFHFKLKAQFDDCVLRNLTPDGEEEESDSDDEEEDGDKEENKESKEKQQIKAEEISSLKSEEDRDILLKTILHSADLSNPAKPWPISKLWSDRVVEEFFNQGDREKMEHLPISPNMDRDTTVQSELSINFTDFIVAPAYVALTSLIPDAVEAVHCLIGNRAKWEDIQTQRLMTIYRTGGEEQGEGKGDADGEGDGEEEVRTKREEELSRWGNRKKAFSRIIGDSLMTTISTASSSVSSFSSSSTSSPKEMVDKFYNNISLGIRRETGILERNASDSVSSSSSSSSSDKEEMNEKEKAKEKDKDKEEKKVDRRKSLRVLEDLILATESKDSQEK